MLDPIEQTTEFALLESIAGALRTELGSEIEEQPAFRDPAEAGQVNRAFRVVASVILRSIALPDESPAMLLTGVLLRLAQRRLAQSGVSECDAEFLLQVEPDRDDWLAFLLLTTDAEIAHLLESERPDRS